MRTDKIIMLKKELERSRSKFPDFIIEYSYNLEMNVSLSSCISYLSDLNTFLEFMIQNNKTDATIKKDIRIEEICALTLRDIYQYLSFLNHYKMEVNTKSGKKTIREYENNSDTKFHKCLSLNALFEYFLKNRIIKYNFLKDMNLMKSRNSANLQTRLTNVEVKLLVETIRNSSVKTPTESYLKNRDLLIVLILVHTGIRVSELCDLNVSDINIQEATFIVTRKGNMRQRLPFPVKLIPQLNMYLKIREKKNLDNIFLLSSLQNKRIRTRSILDILRKYTKKAGIDKNVSPHTLRRTFGTSFYNENKDMYLTAYILGHSSAETTRKYYAIPDVDRANQSLQSFNYG